MIAAVLLFATIGANAQRWGNDNTPYTNDRPDRYERERHERGGRYRDEAYKVGAINQFQRQARIRIADGIVNGTINSREAARLLAFAERIEMKENRYTRNGRMNPREQRELEEDLAALDRMIQHEKHDGNNAPVDMFNRPKF